MTLGCLSFGRRGALTCHCLGLTHAIPVVRHFLIHPETKLWPGDCFIVCCNKHLTSEVDMKKAILLSVAMSFVALGAQAKVADFNALINQNVAAQKVLHQEVETQMGETRMALQKYEETTLLDDVKTAAINVPTDKKFLRFRKEIVQHQAPQKVMNKRIASEIKSMNNEF